MSVIRATDAAHFTEVRISAHCIAQWFCVLHKRIRDGSRKLSVGMIGVWYKPSRESKGSE